MPAQLDLIIRAAEKVDVAVRQKARQIAGAINRFRSERRNHNETLGSELGPPPVAASHAIAADEEFADLTNGNGIEIGIEHVDLRVGDGLPNGNVHLRIFDAAGGGPDRRLRRPVHVVDLALENLAQMMDERRGNGLAAEQQLFERAQRSVGSRIERQHTRQ